MEKPTVGRKVWVWTNGTSSVQDTAQPFDGTVIFVHPGASLIDVQYVNHWGTMGTLKAISLRAPRENAAPMVDDVHRVLDRHGADQFNYATWMPYQMKQAAKAGQHPAVAASHPFQVEGNDAAS